MMQKLPLIALALFVTACATTKLLTPAQSDVDRVSNKFPGYTVAELHEGKTIFTQHCGNCHGYKNPTSRTEAQWRVIVPRMVVKVNKKEGNVIDSKKEETLLKYVITMSTAPKPAKGS